MQKHDIENFIQLMNETYCMNEDALRGRDITKDDFKATEKSLWEIATALNLETKFYPFKF